MAQLIKRLSKPVKYTASRHEQIFKPNHLLSEKAFFEKEQSRLLFDDFKKQIREVLEDYKSTRQQDRFDGMKRGYDADRKNVLIGIIKASMAWQKNIEIETKSMLNLAKKIGENILNQSDCIEIRPQYRDNLIQKMTDFFSITINLPQPLFDKYYFSLPNQGKLSDQISLLTITEYDKDPQLSVCLSQEIFILSLSGIDIKHLFSKINKFFLKSSS